MAPTRHPAAKAARQSRCQTLLQACAALSPVPGKIVADQLRSYPAAKSLDPGTGEREASVRQSCGRLNNRAQISRQPTRERERRLRDFRDPKST
jgi:putative transposase